MRPRLPYLSQKKAMEGTASHEKAMGGTIVEPWGNGTSKNIGALNIIIYLLWCFINTITITTRYSIPISRKVIINMNLHHVLLMLVLAASASPAYSTTIIAADNDPTAGTIAASSTDSSSSVTTTRLNLHGGHANDARSAAATTVDADGARSHLRHLTKVNYLLLCQYLLF